MPKFNDYSELMSGGGHDGVEGVKVEWRGSRWSGGGHCKVEGSSLSLCS